MDIQLQRTLNSAQNAAGNCKFRRKTHGNLVLRGSFHRRRLCKFKEMRYRIRRSEACGKGIAPTGNHGGKQTQIRADAI